MHLNERKVAKLKKKKAFSRTLTGIFFWDASWKLTVSPYFDFVAE